MKKFMIIVILLLVIVIFILSITLYKITNHNSNQINNSTNSINENTNKINSNEIDYMLDGPGSEKETYLGHPVDEWQSKVKEFYLDNYNRDDINVTLYNDEDGKFVINVTGQFDVIAEYEVDDDGIASDRFSDTSIDFLNGHFIPSDPSTNYDNVIKNVGFTDNECLAIGYVTDLNEVKFIDKYFGDPLLYGSIGYYDYRYSEKREPGYGNKFVIIPINDKVKITVYDCYLDNDGEIKTDNTLISSISEPFILLDDYIEYIPKMMIKFEYNGFEDMFPITFSGEDGSLVLAGHEMEVKDISLY